MGRNLQQAGIHTLSLTYTQEAFPSHFFVIHLFSDRGQKTPTTISNSTSARREFCVSSFRIMYMIKTIETTLLLIYCFRTIKNLIKLTTKSEFVNLSRRIFHRAEKKAQIFFQQKTVPLLCFSHNLFANFLRGSALLSCSAKDGKKESTKGT